MKEPEWDYAFVNTGGGYNKEKLLSLLKRGYEIMKATPMRYEVAYILRKDLQTLGEK